jgi:hypothetical protein
MAEKLANIFAVFVGIGIGWTLAEVARGFFAAVYP